MISQTERKIIYPLSLLLSTNKKTAESLSKTSNVSGDTMLRILDKNAVSPETLAMIAVAFFGTNRLHVIIDDTIIQKMYSTLIEGSGDNYDSSKHQYYRSLCTVVAMVSNGWFALPVTHEFWINKDVLKDEYKTKVQIAKKLIEHLSMFICIDTAILDGLYATQEMITWLNGKGINYEMRFHSNRLIHRNESDIPLKVRHHDALKLNGTKKAKTVRFFWKGISVYITSVKRTNKKGISSIVYQISNAKLSAQQHVRLYEYRWNIEIFFRTAKQSLGLMECQSRKLSLQKNHIFNVFFAYIVLQFERKIQKLKNPESALRNIRCKNYNQLIAYLPSLDQIFHAFGVANA
jgi:hypothetical protein